MPIYIPTNNEIFSYYIPWQLLLLALNIFDILLAFLYYLSIFYFTSFWSYVKYLLPSQSVQSLSCVWLFVTPCMTGFPVHHQLLEHTQTHVHRVSDAIQPFHLSSPSPPAFNLSQNQGVFQWVSSSHQVPKVLEFQLQHQSFFQWIFRTDFL